ncbi:hypothetical protein ALC53_04573 [Atta colombica]|uniref:Mos1 transposase HTH domain-containing protein n=1 Tax=Atta colombica TaxID=520822 RepID=A0A195BKT0_9HYME|nr:hypothetical protein ALC53_04573 [Atta colombica]
MLGNCFGSDTLKKTAVYEWHERFKSVEKESDAHSFHGLQQGKQLVDNTPSHSAIIIREFLTKNETNTIQQPSNSPDMAPCNFFLFDQKIITGNAF